MRRLDEEDTKFLLKKPESGIGYQILSIEARGWTSSLVAVAFNAEFLVADLREIAEPEEEYEDPLRGWPLVETDAVRVWVPEYALRIYHSGETPFQPEDVEMLEPVDRLPQPPEPPATEGGYLASRLTQRRPTDPDEGLRGT